MTADTLRRAAQSITERAAEMRAAFPGYDTEPKFLDTVARWLKEEAVGWDVNFEATQRPSRGVDEPPAVHYGDPQAAAQSADFHARRALATARAWLGEDS